MSILRTFKFLTNAPPNLDLRWVTVTIHRYKFRVYTYQSDIVIYSVLREIGQNFMTVFNEDIDRDRIGTLLGERFTAVINVYNEII